MALSAPTAPNAVMTHTVGFFNPHKWSMIVNISAVNVNMTVGPGQYVTTREGKKINDPLLEAYVGPDMLAKETCKDGTPQVLFFRPAPMIVSGATGVSTSTDVVKDSRGIVQASSFDKIAEHATPGASNSAIKVYTVAAAVKNGIIKPLIVPGDNAPTETQGQPLRGEAIPSIDSMTPREAKPSELKKIKTELAAVKEPETTLPIPDIEEEMELSPEEIAEKTNNLLKAITPQKTKKEFVCKADGKVFTKRSLLLYHVKRKFPDKEAELMEGY